MGAVSSRVGLVPLQKRTEEDCMSFHHVRTQEEVLSMNRKQVLTRHQICQCPELGLPSLQNCEQYISVANRYPVYGYVVIAA